MKVTVIKDKQEALNKWHAGKDVRECDTLQCTCVSFEDLNMEDIMAGSEKHVFYVVIES